LLIIAGSAKAGTSALVRWLALHPDVVSGRIKEPRYFTRFSNREWKGPGSEGFVKSMITDAADYAANFPNRATGQWAIDASTDYLWCPESLDLIRHYAQNAEVKVLCIIRDPLERAVSEYNHTIRYEWETRSFAEALDAEPERIRGAWQPLFYHCRRSTIREDLHRFHDAFKQDLMILDYADLKQPRVVLSKLVEFLDFTPFENFEIPKVNQSFLPRNQIIKKMLKSRTIKSLGHSLVSSQVRKRIWQSLHTNSQDVKTVSQRELEKMYALLADEIGACISDPLVPTSSWRFTGSFAS